MPAQATADQAQLMEPYPQGRLLESPERALHEAEKLIAEKVRKGYQEQVGGD